MRLYIENQLSCDVTATILTQTLSIDGNLQIFPKHTFLRIMLIINFFHGELSGSPSKGQFVNR